MVELLGSTGVSRSKLQRARASQSARGTGPRCQIGRCLWDEPATRARAGRPRGRRIARASAGTRRTGTPAAGLDSIRNPSWPEATGHAREIPGGSGRGSRGGAKILNASRAASGRRKESPKATRPRTGNRAQVQDQGRQALKPLGKDREFNAGYRILAPLKQPGQPSNGCRVLSSPAKRRVQRRSSIGPRFRKLMILFISSQRGTFMACGKVYAVAHSSAAGRATTMRKSGLWPKASRSARWQWHGQSSRAVGARRVDLRRGRGRGRAAAEPFASPCCVSESLHRLLDCQLRLDLCRRVRRLARGLIRGYEHLRMQQVHRQADIAYWHVLVRPRRLRVAGQAFAFSSQNPPTLLNAVQE